MSGQWLRHHGLLKAQVAFIIRHVISPHIAISSCSKYSDVIKSIEIIDPITTEGE